MPILLILCWFFPTLLFASQSVRYYQEVQSAKNSINQSLNNPSFKNFDVNSYCNDAECSQQIRNPDQAKYYGNDAGMVDDGMIVQANDPNAKNLVDANKNRPKYDLDPNDPALVRAKGYMDDSYNISHGISSKYHDCEGGQQCSYAPTTRTCERATNQPVFCISEPTFSLDIGETRYRCPEGWERKGDTCYGEVKECRYDNHNYVASSSGYGGNGTTYRWNGNNVNSTNYSKGEHVTSNSYQCGPQGDFWCRSSRYEICGMVPTEQSAELHCDDGYSLSGAQCIKNNVVWKDNCNAIPSECQFQQSQCLQGKETRIINGLPTTLDCWERRQEYYCDYADTCAALLSAPAKNTSTVVNCEEKKTVCDISVLGVCLKHRVELACEQQRCEQVNLVCGETSFCLDGDCYQGEIEKSDSFAENASALAALSEAAKDFSEDTVKIFTGTAAYCDKKPIGLSDCCADKGWGNDIGLTQCSEQEIGLGKAKEKGLTIYIGEYCAEEVLGVCIRKKKSYCQFDSKMARIIQEQGKVHLGMNFGSKEKPNCVGITPEQMQALDFSKIDFSDFYADMEEGMTLPDMEHLQDAIKDKFTDVK